MVQDIFRDSTIGQAINYISSGRLFPYADQRPDFKVPPQFLHPSERKTALSSPESDATTICDETDKSGKRISTPGTQLTREDTIAIDGAEELAEKQIDEALKSDPYTVGWYGDDDPENPRNWSPKKRAFVAFSISLLTFSVYIGSAIYTPSIPGIMADFNVSLTKATLGLTLYVLAYGIGPMFLSPLQELPKLGRNPVYMSTLFLFVIFQIPVATAQNISTILAFRFLTGLVGSPALATGGASMGDIYPMHQYAYVLGIWALGAVAGPITGPVVGGFAAQANGWRWPQYELLWIAGFSLIFLLLLLPETYEPTILLRRAQRLRKLTGNQELRSQSERAAEGESFAEVMKEALTRPFILAKEPVLMFANLYIGFVYAIFYLWFEAFPLVFIDIYHFNLGTSGLPFLAFVVTGAITYFVYVLYQMYHIAPRYARADAEGKEIAPEIRLEIGLMASIFIPTSVLIFGFASKESIHWIVPVIGASLYLPGIYLCFQSILTYVTSSYPAYAASVLAGNDLFRSSIASVFPLFGRAFFVNLGLGPASALLAGISILMMPAFLVRIASPHI
ncbi:major facilitator superfamily domain-containing protein [Armillaria borealis]|uniref:Major facilitator superfamily domain-containing protein n=1 Tax=Armillaria borealis TaxID=47425 RepID=A0AA39J9X4_9AGAR|nr:major facilitator superfamily domain-containing protein [Armillaria borealis]